MQLGDSDGHLDSDVAEEVIQSSRGFASPAQTVLSKPAPDSMFPVMPFGPESHEACMVCASNADCSPSTKQLLFT